MAVPPGKHIELEYHRIRRAGGVITTTANLNLNSSSPIIRNCTIRNSAGSGIYLTSATNSPIVQNSVIYGNKWGVYNNYFQSVYRQFLDLRELHRRRLERHDKPNRGCPRQLVGRGNRTLPCK